SPWPKLFHNLRATRQTELAETWPEHVVCAWIGNSRDVARKHYLQVTDDHFDRAAAGKDSAAQSAAQEPAESSAGDPQPVTVDTQEAANLQGESVSCEVLQAAKVGGTGFEPVTPSVSCPTGGDFANCTL